MDTSQAQDLAQEMVIDVGVKNTWVRTEVVRTHDAAKASEGLVT